MFLCDDVIRSVTLLIRGALQRDIPITATLKSKKANNKGET